MATKRVGTIFVELDLDPSRYMRAQQTMVKESKSGAKILEKNFKNLGIKSNATFDLMRNQAVQSFEAIKRSGKATANDLVRAEKAKADRIKQINEEQYGHQTTLLENLKSHWKGYAVAVTAALYTIQKIGTKAITAAMEQEKAHIALGAALRANSEYTDELMNQYTAFASSIQTVTTYGDEQILKLMALQKNLGVTSDRLEEATKASIGLAAATGRDVNSMAMYIALAEQGEFTMLRRYIPALRSTTDATEQLQIITDFAARGFLVAQENAQTFSGGLEQLRNLYGDVLERIGDVVVKNETLLALMERGKQTLIEWVGHIERWVEANDELIAQKTHEAIAEIVDTLNSMIKIYKNLPDGVIGATGVGIVGRMISGSTPIGVLTASLVLLNEQLKIMNLSLSQLPQKYRDLGESTRNIWNAILGKKDWRTGADLTTGDIKDSWMGRPLSEPLKLTIGGPGTSGRGEAEAYQQMTDNLLSLTILRGEEMMALEMIQAELLAEQMMANDTKKLEEKSRLELYMTSQLYHDLERMGWEHQATLKQQDAQEKAMLMTKLGIYQSVAGQVANTFLQISQAGGKQSKEAFKMYQAFAIVQAGMATAMAIIKTLAEPMLPWPSNVIMAGIIGAMGAVQIGMIASAQPPSYDQGGISQAKGVYQTGNISEAHIPLKSGKVPVNIKGEVGTTFIIKMENPVFQDVAIQRQVFAQIAEVIARKVAPSAVVQSYRDDGPIRQIVRGRA